MLVAPKPWVGISSSVTFAASRATFTTLVAIAIAPLAKCAPRRHALVAGGALAGDGHWIVGKPGFLFPDKALSSVFRGKFMAAIIAAHAAGGLQADGLHLAKMTPKQIKEANHVWRTMLAQLRKHDWVVYAKAPLGGPAQVLEYLARYTHRIAISNERLTSLHDGIVTFAVRNNEESGPRKRHESLPVDVFIQRFMQHCRRA